MSDISAKILKFGKRAIRKAQKNNREKEIPDGEITTI